MLILHSWDLSHNSLTIRILRSATNDFSGGAFSKGDCGQVQLVPGQLSSLLCGQLQPLHFPLVLQFQGFFVCFFSLSRSAQALSLLHFILMLPGILPVSMHVHEPLLTYRSSANSQGSFSNPLFLLFLPSAQRAFLGSVVCSLPCRSRIQLAPLWECLCCTWGLRVPGLLGGHGPNIFGNCSSDAMGEIHTSPQPLWCLMHPHSAAECTEMDLLRFFKYKVCILNTYLSCQQSCSSYLLWLQLLPPAIGISLLFPFELAPLSLHTSIPSLHCTPHLAPWFEL